MNSLKLATISIVFFLYAAGLRAQAKEENQKHHRKRQTLIVAETQNLFSPKVEESFNPLFEAGVMREITQHFGMFGLTQISRRECVAEAGFYVSPIHNLKLGLGAGVQRFNDGYGYAKEGASFPEHDRWNFRAGAIAHYHSEHVISFASMEFLGHGGYNYLGSADVQAFNSLKWLKLGIHAQRHAGIGPRIRADFLSNKYFDIGLWGTVTKDLESRHVNYIAGIVFEASNAGH